MIGFNTLFHVTTAALGLALPIELAGKLVVAAYFVVFALAAIQLLDAVAAPRWRALLLLPLATGYAFAFGFVNFALGLAIQLLVLARVLRDDKPLPTALLALLGVYSHVLPSAIVYALLGAAVAAQRRPRAALPLLPSIAYGALVLVVHGTARQNAGYVAVEGDSTRVADKVARLFHFATGLRGDRVDELVVMAALAVALIAFLAPRARPAAPALSMLATAAALYLALPHVFFATAFVFERLAAVVILCAIVAAPAPRAALEPLLRSVAYVVALASSLLFLQSMLAARAELRDLDAVLDAAPSGRRVVGLVFQPHLPSFRLRAVLHAPAYYVARRRGEVAFMFDTVSLPVRPRRDRPEMQLPHLFELNPEQYDPSAPYARHFDLALVKSPNETLDPRVLMFRERPLERRVLARAGAYWLIETR